MGTTCMPSGRRYAAPAEVTTTERCQVLRSRLGDLVAQAQQRRRCRVDHLLAGAEFHFHGDPGAVDALDDGVHFEPGVVAVMGDFGVERLAVHTQIAHHERLEQESERLGVREQSLRRRSQQRRRQRRIHEVPLGLLAQRCPRPAATPTTQAALRARRCAAVRPGTPPRCPGWARRRPCLLPAARRSPRWPRCVPASASAAAPLRGCAAPPLACGTSARTISAIRSPAARLAAASSRARLPGQPASDDMTHHLAERGVVIRQVRMSLGLEEPLQRDRAGGKPPLRTATSSSAATRAIRPVPVCRVRSSAGAR